MSPTIDQHVIDRFIATTMQRDAITALAYVLVTPNGADIKCYGHPRWNDHAPLLPNQLYEIGSISKSFASIALLKLVDRSQLDLDRPVSFYLPDFIVPSRYAPITVRHLLTHTAGITSGTDLTTDGRYEVWRLRQCGAAYEPGLRFHYCNVGYRALGLLLEALYDMPLSQVISQEILQPLGMHSTYPYISNDLQNTLLPGYVDQFDDRPYPPHRPLVPAPWIQSFTIDGSLASTLGDMARYLQMLLNEGRAKEERLISAEQYQQLVTPAVQTSFNNSHYALGLFRHDDREKRLIYHHGEMIGIHSALLGDLISKQGLVLYINGPGNALDLAKTIFDAHFSIGNESVRLSSNGTIDSGNGIVTEEFAGSFSDNSGTTLTFFVENGQLFLTTNTYNLLLAVRGNDYFYTDQPPYQKFLFHFIRNDKGKVIAVAHGSDYLGRTGFSYVNCGENKHEWLAYCGSFRSHNPWFSYLTVVQRLGKLWMVLPDGHEVALLHKDKHEFYVGDCNSPERLIFDSFSAEMALHLIYRNGDFYRSV